MCSVTQVTVESVIALSYSYADEIVAAVKLFEEECDYLTRKSPRCAEYTKLIERDMPLMLNLKGYLDLFTNTSVYGLNDWFNVYYHLVASVYEWNLLMERIWFDAEIFDKNQPWSMPGLSASFSKIVENCRDSLKFESPFAIPVRPIVNLRPLVLVYDNTLSEFEKFSKKTKLIACGEMIREYKRIRNDAMSGKLFGNVQEVGKLRSFVEKWNEEMMNLREELRLRFSLPNFDF